MKKYIILFVFILFASTLISAETDAVFKKIKKEYTMHTDGSLEYRYSKQLQLNSQYAFNRMYGETFIVYNPDFQKVKIHYAYTIMANGRKVIVPENAYNKVLPRAASNYPAYNQMVELVITHTGLEVGATIFLDYSIISSPQFIKEMIGLAILEERVIVEDYEVVLKVPARRNLKFSVYNSELKADKKNDGKYRSYAWKFENINARSNEQSAPHGYQIAPTLKFSTFSDMNAELMAFTNQDAFQKEGPTEVQKLIEESRINTFSELELVLELQDYIVNNIATKHIPLAWHNYQLQTPEQVWKTNVGSAKEKNILLWKTFIAAGLKADLVGFYPLPLWQGQQATLDLFSGYGVMVTFKDGYRTIFSASETNARTLELNYPNHIILNMITGTSVNPISLFSHPTIHLNAKITMDPANQIFGDMNLKLGGAKFDQIALQQDTQMIKYAISNPLPFDTLPITAVFPNALNGEFNIKIKGDSVLENQENYYFWDIPYMNNGISSSNFNQLPSLRDFPLIVPAIEEEYHYSITLPKSVVWVGEDIHIAYKESFGEMSLDILLEDGQVKVSKYLKIEPEMVELKLAESMMTVESQEIQANKRTLSLEEYAIFRKMMMDWNSERVNSLVFKR
ncbi:MAG: DUF3857 domain-containing protein [Bacteroidales bacterium]|nr:DUF3857 domain-containing protein [Bacteroidales bacterium]